MVHYWAQHILPQIVYNSNYTFLLIKGVLQFMGSQRVGHNWATELNWSDMYADIFS